MLKLSIGRLCYHHPDDMYLGNIEQQAISCNTLQDLGEADKLVYL